MPISIIIPTYKEADYLDLCIYSILKTQKHDNEIIVVVDGTLEENKHILKKYDGKIKPVVFDTNYGQVKATNYGVYVATNDVVLIVNDDNIFPQDWDEILLKDFNKQTDAMAPNQIEPYDSMFKQFIRQDYGKTFGEFSLGKFLSGELNHRTDKTDDSGSTLPLLISKNNYLMLGGWDESYPSGHVVDWDFFLKCKLAGLKLRRSYKCNFYHFVSIGTRSPEMVENTKKKEVEGFEFFKLKWGSYPTHNPNNNDKGLC